MDNGRTELVGLLVKPGDERRASPIFLRSCCLLETVQSKIFQPGVWGIPDCFTAKLESHLQKKTDVSYTSLHKGKSKPGFFSSQADSKQGFKALLGGLNESAWDIREGGGGCVGDTLWALSSSALCMPRPLPQSLPVLQPLHSQQKSVSS